MIHPLALVKMGATVALDALAEILEESSGLLLTWAERADKLAASLDPGEEYVPIVTPIFGQPDFELASQMIQTAMDRVGETASPVPDHLRYNRHYQDETQA